MFTRQARRFFGWWLVTALAVAAPAIRAEQPVDFAADLARIHVEVIGGREKVEALRAMRSEGTIRIAGVPLSFVLWAQRPDRVRVETVGGDVRITRGYDGVNPPWIRVGDGKAKEQSAEDGAEFVREAEFDNPLYDPAGRGVRLFYEGAEEVRGREWSRIRTEGPAGTAWVYLDESHLLVRRDVRRVIRGNEVLEETYFSDFRPVAGVLLPHLIESRVGNNVLHETTLLRIDPNPFLLEGFFGAR